MSSIQENRSTLREFIASIATIPGDLSSITAPPFLLAAHSTTELPQYWAEHPSNFLAPAAEHEPQKRALLVLKWFLAALRGQQYAGKGDGEGVKKPLNAFLGELFIADWDGGTRLVSEQVGHHPPVTACYLWNDGAGVRAEGYTCQEITFNGSVNIKQIGHAILHLDKWDEDFLIPLPNVKVKGLLSGTPYPELSGTYYIASSSGFVSEIDFSGKGFFSGTKNSFEAKLYRTNESDKPLYTVMGQWNDKFTIYDMEEGKGVEVYDSSARSSTPIHVDDISKQDPWESRRAWGDVISSLKKGDMRGTSNAKSIVEQGQRDMRKTEESRGEKWKAAFFKNESGDSVFEKLASMVGAQLEAERTMGVWKVNQEAIEKAQRPYHGTLVPAGTMTDSPVAEEQETNGDTRKQRIFDAESEDKANPVITPEAQQEAVENDKQSAAKGQLERTEIENFLRDKYKSSKG